MRTLLTGFVGLAGSIAIAGVLALLGAAGSIPLAMLCIWAVAGVYGRRAALADAAAVDAWRRDRAGRRAVRRGRERGRR